MPLLIRLYIKFEPDLLQTYQFDFEANTSLSTNTPSQSKITAVMVLFKRLGTEERKDRRTVRHKRPHATLA